MKIVSLASSSKGNCTYIEANNIRILVDIGINIAKIEYELELLNINIGDISAIVISHEHTDHICGLNAFVKKYHTPVYVHSKIADFISDKLGSMCGAVRSFDSAFSIFELQVLPIPVPHDSRSCFGYLLSYEQSMAAIITDCGHITDQIFDAIKGVPLIYLESNYDEEMLQKCMYPISLKRRISSDKGHLSNIACARVIERLVYTGTRQIVLSHLSENSNSPMLAYTSVKSYLLSKGIIEGTHIKIDVNKTFGPSTIFNV